MQPNPYMAAAMLQAEAAATLGEVPVGAVLVDGATGAIVAAGHNRVEIDCDPTAHAEIQVIRAAARLLNSPRLPGLDLYVTLEPCAMCAASIAQARLRRVYFAAYDPKGGGVEHGPRIFDQPTCHHRPEIYGGIGESAASDLLRRFFAQLR